MKILHTSDWHVGTTLRGRSRADEHRAVLQEMADLADKRAVDVVIVAGDMFHHAAPGPESEDIVYRALLTMARDDRQVVLVAGNHDNPRRVDAIRPLLGRIGIHAVGLPRPRDAGGMLKTVTRGGESACVALLPFLSQRSIVRAADLMAAEAADHVQQYADRYRRIIEHLCEGFEDDAVNLVVSHAAVVGGRVGGGEREAHTIFDYYVPPQVFPADTHYVALGHLHRSQRVSGHQHIRYSGSPIQVDFSEDENAPSVLLIDAEAGRPASIEEVALRSHRQLMRLTGSRAALMEQRDSVGDAYLRIDLEESPSPGLADEIREAFPNAVDVRIVHESEAAHGRTPLDLASVGQSPRSLFARYLEERGVQEEELLNLFDELMEDELEARMA